MRVIKGEEKLQLVSFSEGFAFFFCGELCDVLVGDVKICLCTTHEGKCICSANYC